MMVGWMLLASVAQAETSVSVDSLSVDGLSVRALSCTLERGGLLASALVVGALASKKTELDACAPQGAAFSVSWAWGAETAITAVSGSQPDASNCNDSMRTGFARKGKPLKTFRTVRPRFKNITRRRNDSPGDFRRFTIRLSRSTRAPQRHRARRISLPSESR